MGSCNETDSETKTAEADRIPVTESRADRIHAQGERCGVAARDVRQQAGARTMNLIRIIRKLQRSLSLLWQLLALWKPREKPVQPSHESPDHEAPHLPIDLPDDPADRLR
jgi:hypothetical protein